jgi:hypothetical protein
MWKSIANVQPFRKLSEHRLLSAFSCINITYHLNEGTNAIYIHLIEITGEKINFIKFEERFISKLPLITNYMPVLQPKSQILACYPILYVKPHKLGRLSISN